MPLAYLILTLLVWWRLWTPIDGAIRTWKYDPTHSYWPELVFHFDSFASGAIGLWNPFDHGGQPVYADPHIGLFYPPNWPLWAASALFGGVPFDFISVKFVVHWVFGAAGMHLFLRRLSMPEPACYVGGLLFGWSSPAIRYGGNALNLGYVWLPWILLAIHWFAQRPTYRRAIVLGSVVAMPLLGAAPVMVIYVGIVALPYAVYELWGQLRSSSRYWAVAGVIGLMWILPVVVSNLHALPELARSTRDLQFMNFSVFSTAHFVQFLVPRANFAPYEGENVYYGLFVILCAGTVLASRGRKRALVFAAAGIVGVLLALGHHTGVLASVASAVKPLTWFRRAHRYLYVTSAVMSVLGALGFGYLLCASQERRQVLARRFVWVGGAATMVIAVGYVVSLVGSKNMGTPANMAWGHAFLAAAVATALLRAIAVSESGLRSVYVWAAVCLIAFDLWAANANLIDLGFSKRPSFERDAVLAKLDGDLRTDYRIYDRTYLGVRPGTRLGVRDLGGYKDDPLALSRHGRFVAMAHRHLGMLGHANVRYYFNGLKARGAPRAKDKFRSIQRDVYEVPAVAPAVMYVPRAVSVPDVDVAVKRLVTMVPGQGAVVEGPAPPQSADAPITAGRLTVLERNYAVAEIEAPGPGLIVIAEAFFSAWSARVNGEPVAMQPANALFRGIPISAAGRYRIEMSLRPPQFWAFAPLPLIAFLLLVGAASRPWWSSRSE